MINSNNVESWRKWITTIVIVVIIPLVGLYVSYQRLLIMQEIQEKYLSISTYRADRSVTDLRLVKTDTLIEGMGTKLDSILQSQAATQEHLKAIENRLDKKQQ